MKTLQRLFVLLGGIVGFSIQAETNIAGTFPLTGKVVDADGRPVAGAVVERYQLGHNLPYVAAELEMRERVTADAQGAFEFRASRTLLWLLARKPGLAPAWRLFMPSPSAEQRLVLVSPTILAGVVVDEADKPVADAEVCVAAAYSETALEGGGRAFNYLRGKPARDCFAARTAADGRFRIEGFPTNASADLLVRAPGKALRQLARENQGPDSMQCRAGQEDIRLVLEPAGSIEGKIAAEEAGQSLPVAQLTLQPDGPGSARMALRQPDQSDADSAFRMNDVPAGSYRLCAVFGTNAVPEWVAENVPVSVESGQATRGVLMSASRGGFLEVAILGKNGRKPLEQVGVAAYGQTFQTGASSGSNGLARLRLPPGSYQVSASKEGWPSQNSSASVEAGQTNRVEIELAPPPRITGVVRRPDGQPAAGLPLRIVPGYSPDIATTTTDANGKFDMEWNPQRDGSDTMSFCLIIRDAERNLAVAQDIDEETGPLDLRLAPGLTLAGRAECGGKPITNASAVLVFWSGNRGMHLPDFATRTNVPGRFELPALPPGRKYGLYVSAPGYGQHNVNEVESSEARRVELDPVELKLANLKLAGRVLDSDDKPVANANVHLSGEGQPSGSARTDREGQFRFAQVCEGQVRLSASARSSDGSVSAEGGETNVILRLGESYSSSASSSPRKLKGIVTGPDGQPVAGAQVAVFPAGSGRTTKTAADGTFALTWSVEPWQTREGNPSLVVREPARNLAAAEEVSEETTNLNVRLKPALAVTGRVEGPGGAPLPNAQVGVWLLVSRTYSQVGEQLISTDARGHFEIKGLPASEDYTVFASAKGHGRSEQKLDGESGTNRIELEPFVLKLADRVLSGQVVDANDKPVSGAHVSTSGEDQPQTSVTTDAKGRFKLQVCEGEVRLHASSQTGYVSASLEASDTNAVLQLTSYDSSSRSTPRRAALKGKPLPDLTGLGLAADASPAGRPVLLCLLDVEQRPSRRLVRLLAEQHRALQQKGLTVLVLQAAISPAESWKEWKDTTPLPFPVGRVTETSEKTRWVSAVESLPWLILTDAQGRVAAEGFPLEELDAKLQALGK